MGPLVLAASAAVAVPARTPEARNAVNAVESGHLPVRIRRSNRLDIEHLPLNRGTNLKVS
jgi:hypothetical protein